MCYLGNLVNFQVFCFPKHKNRFLLCFHNCYAHFTDYFHDHAHCSAILHVILLHNMHWSWILLVFVVTTNSSCHKNTPCLNNMGERNIRHYCSLSCSHSVLIPTLQRSPTDNLVIRLYQDGYIKRVPTRVWNKAREAWFPVSSMLGKHILLYHVTLLAPLVLNMFLPLGNPS